MAYAIVVARRSMSWLEWCKVGVGLPVWQQGSRAAGQGVLHRCNVGVRLGADASVSKEHLLLDC